jgi:hypothetical protein
MSTNLRHIFIAISLLLLAEDSQYLLKIGDVGAVQTIIEQLADFEDSECDDETKDEKEADKDEKKERDENTNPAHSLVLNTGYLLINAKKHCLVLAPLSKLAHELESPPPEV